MEQTNEALFETIQLLKRQVFWTRIAALCMAACILAVGIGLAVVLPRVSETVQDTEHLLTETSQTIADAQEVFGNLVEITEEMANADLEELVNSVNELVQDSGEGLSTVLSKLDEVDLQTLNKAIADLQKVIEPLANLVRVFG